MDNSLLTINKLISDNNCEEARVLLNNIIDEDNLLISYLRRKLEEKETIDYDVMEDIEYGNFYMEMYEKYRGLRIALYYYYNGLRKSGNNIFNYYIGKTFYKRLNFEKSLEYFKKYISRGGMKLDKAYYYLSHIYKRCNKYKNQDLSEKYLELATLLFEFNEKTENKKNKI